LFSPYFGSRDPSPYPLSHRRGREECFSPGECFFPGEGGIYRIYPREGGMLANKKTKTKRIPSPGGEGRVRGLFFGIVKGLNHEAKPVF
jgi:hypothetical protein